jgi:hypothetical protein
MQKNTAKNGANHCANPNAIPGAEYRVISGFPSQNGTP